MICNKISKHWIFTYFHRRIFLRLVRNENLIVVVSKFSKCGKYMVSQGGGANLERYVFFKGGWGHKRKRKKEKGKKKINFYVLFT